MQGPPRLSEILTSVEEGKRHPGLRERHQLKAWGDSALCIGNISEDADDGEPSTFF